VAELLVCYCFYFFKVGGEGAVAAILSLRGNVCRDGMGKVSGGMVRGKDFKLVVVDFLD